MAPRKCLNLLYIRYYRYEKYRRGGDRCSSIVSGSYNQMIRFWDAVTGAALQTLEGHSDAVWSVAYSPNSKQVMSGSDDKTVRLWDTVMGAALQTLKGHSGRFWSVSFSPDGKAVNTLLVSKDWIAEGGTNILWLPPNYRPPTCIAVWKRIVVLGHSSGRISFLQFKEGSKLI